MRKCLEEKYKIPYRVSNANLSKNSGINSAKQLLAKVKEEEVYDMNEVNPRKYLIEAIQRLKQITVSCTYGACSTKGEE